MLPSSSLPSISEKVRAHRDREENADEEDVREAEKSARFGRSTAPRNVQDFGDMLLGPEFNDVRYDGDDSGAVDAEIDLRKELIAKSPTEIEKRDINAAEEAKDWTVRPLAPSVLSMLENLTSVDISVPTARGGRHNVTLCARTIDRIRGSSAATENNNGISVLSWLDDNVIDGFMSLINSRSEATFKGKGQVHKPSKAKDVFTRPRVRAFAFSSQFYTIWKRAQNGGYSNVKRWRRKIPDFNTVGIFLFPAFVNQNHWVLAVVDVDGQQFMYYDPQMRPDTWDVIKCAKEWISGEVRTAVSGDAFKGLEISSWPTTSNPWRIPAQMEAQSCGVFVLYVAEHLERGAVPLFTQSDIPILRLRMLFLLHQGALLGDADTMRDLDLKNK